MQFQNCQGESLLAHRFVIAQYSDPLASMLCPEFQEGSTGEVEIEDTDPATLKIFRDYMYTDEVSCWTWAEYNKHFAE